MRRELYARAHSRRRLTLKLFLVPRGMAIRFTLPNGKATDIVAISHNGFLVATGEEFLEFFKARAATDPTKPHPWPIEAFIGSHPAALKFVQDPKPTPVSFAAESFFANNAFAFVNKDGVKQMGRFQMLPAGEAQYLNEAAAKAKAPNFLFEELKSRLAEGSAKFRLVLQLASAGDKREIAQWCGRTIVRKLIWERSRLQPSIPIALRQKNLWRSIRHS